MKAINLKSLVQTYRHFDADTYQSFLAYFGLQIQSEDNHCGIKPQELSSLWSLTESLEELLPQQTLVFEDFFVGYTIPQIGKEFDLLRFGRINQEDCIINIELKAINTHEKIHRQVLRNKYYLKFLKRKLFLYTFVEDSRELFRLNEDDTLESVSLDELAQLLLRQSSQMVEDVDAFFDPSNYLVSPFNATDKFLLDAYFLTTHQEQIKKHIIKELLPRDDVRYISVTGGAGTGKTLLTYDIAKALRRNAKKVVIAHCGKLNQGQDYLNEHKWNICTTESLLFEDLADYDILIVDEAQRLSREQFHRLKEQMRGANKLKVLFSYDGLQWLRSQERKTGVVQEIERLSAYNGRLTNKIRTNPEIASFIRRLFNREEVKASNFPFPNIKLHYVFSWEEAELLAQKLHQEDWQIAGYMSQCHCSKSFGSVEEKHTLSIIGQEYDKVVALIDESFTYDSSGSLISAKTSSDYAPEQILYQTLTRTRRALALIIIDNQTILKRCLAILNQT